MTENSRNDFEVEIERNKDGIHIRLKGIQIDKEKSQFKDACKLVQELWYIAEREVTEIDNELWYFLENTRIQHLWHQQTNQLSKDVKENLHRIALCLLREFPICMTQQKIADISGIPRTTVSDNLGNNYFRKCKTGFQLSEIGIDWLRNDVIKQYIAE